MADTGNTIDCEGHKDLTFEGMKVPFAHSNEDWALANLPNVRIASLLLRDNDTELTSKMSEMVKEGVVPEMLDGMVNTKEHLEGIVKVLDMALTRSFIVLDRLGYSPEMPPPDGTIQ